jgi:predicted acyl esterase
MTPRRTIALAVTAALVVAACSGSDDDDARLDTTVSTTASDPASDEVDGTVTDSGEQTTPSTQPSTSEPAETFGVATFAIAPGTEQVTVTGAKPGDTLTLIDGDGTDIASGAVDDFGALLFRDVEGGSIVRVRDTLTQTDEVMVMSRGDSPVPAFYTEQRLPTDGLGYITTRDGTTLSASVWLPGPAEDGPYPTIVEYSGYSPSDPDSQGFSDLFVGLGYAYVGVNIRGTGCSGGSFNYFEYVQSLDGYDAIETVAAQPWVQNNRVGMVGVSYPGISQLFVAQTQPPSLSAITPFSVIADTAISTLYPGGILNTGFAVEWANDRTSEARPEGQGWTTDRIEGGDDVCAANQQLRLQNPDLLGIITANQFWSDDVAAELAPRLFADRITVPTFVAGAWQDEQTGGHFPTMLDQFTGTDHLYATLLNGLHTESIGPAVLPRLIEFLDLYVAERTPTLGVARTFAPLLGGGLYGTTDIALPAEDRFAGMSHAEALAAFESEPPIRVLFEEGAADGFPARAPMPRFEAAFDAWPVPEAIATEWYLTGAGRLGNSPNEDPSSTDYLALPDAIPPTFFDESSGNIWSVDVEYDWQEGGLGTFAAWATDPLAAETVVVGSGSVDLYVMSNLGDTDLEVTITEIRPDGQEMYVQSGWLRASHRTLDEATSTELRPVHAHLEADASPLPDGVFELIRVELLPFAHVFRAGSRIRLIVDAPGGNRPLWEFDTIAGGEKVTIGHDPLFSSRVVLPVVASVDAPDEYPECGALRGQPCRIYTGP